MDNQKWLKRKYPKSYKYIKDILNDERIRALKYDNFRLGIMTVADFGYEKGTYIIFLKANPINSYNYPFHYCVTKCKKDGVTASGWQGFGLIMTSFDELND